jgi:hypothetical protein
MIHAVGRQKPIPPRPSVCGMLLGRLPPSPAPVLARPTNDASLEARAYASSEAPPDTSSAVVDDGLHPRRALVLHAASEPSPT